MFGRSVQTKSSDWVFTINNYTPSHVKRLRVKFYKYIIFGYERGKNGTPHLQGYIEFPVKYIRLEVKKMFMTRKVWLQPRTHTPFQVRRYCMKDGSYEEFGEFENCPITKIKKTLPFCREYEV